MLGNQCASCSFKHVKIEGRSTGMLVWPVGKALCLCDPCLAHRLLGKSSATAVAQMGLYMLLSNFLWSSSSVRRLLLRAVMEHVVGMSVLLRNASAKCLHDAYAGQRRR